MPDIVWAQKMKSWRRKVRLSAAMCWTSSQRWSWFSAFWLGKMHLQPVKKVLDMQAFTLELSCTLWFQWWSVWKSQLSDQGFLWESWMRAGAQEDGKSSPAIGRSLMVHPWGCSPVTISSPHEASHCSLLQTSTDIPPVSHSRLLEAIWDDLPCEQMCFPPLLCPTTNDLR